MICRIRIVRRREMTGLFVDGRRRWLLFVDGR